MSWEKFEITSRLDEHCVIMSSPVWSKVNQMWYSISSIFSANTVSHQKQNFLFYLKVHCFTFMQKSLTHCQHSEHYCSYDSVLSEMFTQWRRQQLFCGCYEWKKGVTSWCSKTESSDTAFYFSSVTVRSTHRATFPWSLHHWEWLKPVSKVRNIFADGFICKYTVFQWRAFWVLREMCL